MAALAGGMEGEREKERHSLTLTDLTVEEGMMSISYSTQSGILFVLVLCWLGGGEDGEGGQVGRLGVEVGLSESHALSH